MTDTVAQFPTKLERLAASIGGLLARDAANRKEWIEIKLSLCAEFVDARIQFKADQVFGDWCRTHFDIDRNDRTAYVAMGRDLELAREILEITERRSIRHIYEKEFKPMREVRLRTTFLSRKPGENKVKIVHQDGTAHEPASVPAATLRHRKDKTPVEENAINVMPLRQDGTAGKRFDKRGAKLVQEPSPTRFTDAFKSSENPKERVVQTEYTPLELLTLNLHEMREGFKRAEAGYRAFEHARKNLVNDPRESIAIYSVKHDLERISLFIKELWPFISKFFPEQAQTGPQTVLLLPTVNTKR